MPATGHRGGQRPNAVLPAARASNPLRRRIPSCTRRGQWTGRVSPCLGVGGTLRSPHPASIGPTNQTNMNKPRKPNGYERYITSELWQDQRANALKVHGAACQACGTSGKINVHHLDYRHHHDVTADDLMVLCERCHHEAHNNPALVGRVRSCGKVEAKRAAIIAFFTDVRAVVAAGKERPTPPAHTYQRIMSHNHLRHLMERKWAKREKKKAARRAALTAPPPPANPSP